MPLFCRLAFLAGLACFLSILPAQAAPAPARPNIVVILADDLGYGDLGCYGATRVKTPHLDRMAAQGLRFTSAYSPAATCTPTRYSLLTGEYAWRKKGTGILTGDTALIIEPGRVTLPSLLQKAGYATAAVGKWHLGLGAGQAPLDWNGDIKPGPLEIGFDYCFILPATGDRVPCVYVENHRVVGLDPKDPLEVSYQKPVGHEPTGKDHPELLRMQLAFGHDMTIVNGISRIGWMSGGRAARWSDEDMADTLARKAIQFIESHRSKPFFLYLAAHDIHVPRVPHQRFAGTSQCGVRGDVIHQFDDTVGQVLQALDRLKLADQTLVILSSDNGPVINDGYDDGADRDLNGHRPAGPLRGSKYSMYEGGARVPFLVRWPGRVKPGVSTQLVSLIDLSASLGALAGQPLPDGAAPDSFNVLGSILGEAKTSARPSIVEQARSLTLHRGPWKYIPAHPEFKVKPNSKFDLGFSATEQLYDLSKDLGETNNVAARHPEVAREMKAALEAIQNKPASRP